MIRSGSSAYIWVVIIFLGVMRILSSGPISSSFSKGRPLLEVKADLYAILTTASYLKQKLDQGLIDFDFFFKRMQAFSQELGNLQAEISPKYSLTSFFNQNSINPHLYAMVAVISSINDYHFQSLARQWQIDPFQLATTSADITSHFITFLDYVHLVDYIDPEFLCYLLDQLQSSVSSMHTFSWLNAQLTQFSQQLQNELPRFVGSTSTSPEISKPFLKSLEDHLFTLYHNFKQYLHTPSA